MQPIDNSDEDDLLHLCSMLGCESFKGAQMMRVKRTRGETFTPLSTWETIHPDSPSPNIFLYA